MSSPKFCSECGTPLKADSKFCSNCGAKLGAAAATAAAPAAEAPKEAAQETPPPAPAPADEAAPAAPAPPPAAEAPEPDDDADDGKNAEVAAAAEKAVAAEASAKGAFKDPVAAMLSGDEDDDDADYLGMPADGEAPAGKELPIGLISLGLLLALLVGGGGYVASNEELSARFQCNIMGRKAMCVTEEDRLFEIDKQRAQEELELMQHHYGGFDLNFTPEKEATFTLRQTRYEETREDFVQRVRAGAKDGRARKEVKVGEYSTGKNKEGVIKGRIAFKKSAQPPTFKPAEGMELVLPLTLNDLPLLEREQVEASNPEKRLTADDIKAIEHKRNNPERDAEGNLINEKKLKVETVALSSWVYEIDITAPGYEERKVLFYEAPLPPDMDDKKLEEAGVTLRAFKRRPDGRFVIANASFDLLPKPETIRTRYIQLLKELHCLRESKEYQGKNEQGKADAENLIWEQKAFTKVLREIAEKNHGMEDWEEYKKKEFDGYKCPKPIVEQAR